MRQRFSDGKRRALLVQSIDEAGAAVVCRRQSLSSGLHIRPSRLQHGLRQVQVFTRRDLQIACGTRNEVNGVPGRLDELGVVGDAGPEGGDGGRRRRAASRGGTPAASAPATSPRAAPSPARGRCPSSRFTVSATGTASIAAPVSAARANTASIRRRRQARPGRVVDGHELRLRRGQRQRVGDRLEALRPAVGDLECVRRHSVGARNVRGLPARSRRRTDTRRAGTRNSSADRSQTARPSSAANTFFSADPKRDERPAAGRMTAKRGMAFLKDSDRRPSVRVHLTAAAFADEARSRKSR